ncbi:MAG: amidase [Pseudomonadota bacterium]
MKHLLISAAVGVLCAGCSSVADVAATAQADVEATMPERAAELVLQTLPEIAAALETGAVSSEELVTAYLMRIETIDRSGPTLQSVLAVNPTALADAVESDARRSMGKAWGPLDGVPILLKDNIESLDPVATTAGALALKDNVTGRDSPLVAGLRAQGAIILGKTNLSQWANFRSNDSMSGWSALGGQVRNPHMLDRNPCGSSSGSGAAAAASLAAGTVGTETNGSVICPSNVNGIVGFKPTVGLVAQDYIVPISSSQDTAGPMTKSVKGAAMMLNAMATGAAKTDYVAALDGSSLSGKRVGVMRFSQGSNADILMRFDAALAVLEAQGAVLVDIEDFSPDAENFWGDALSVLQYEFKHTLNEYLASTPDAVTTRSLADLIAFNEVNADIELALFDQSLFEASEAKGAITDEDYIAARDAVQVASRTKGIDKLLADNDVHMLVSPSGPLSPRVDPVNGDTWPAWAGAGYLAAIAGYPHITVPMGEVHGVPIGFSIMSGKDMDADVLSWGYAYEQASQLRATPQYLANAEARPEIAAAMKAK